jgi:hypothetical protein
LRRLFRIPDHEPVLFGDYARDHVEISAAAAAGIMMKADDPPGMQILVQRRIKANEIVTIRSLPQVIGWRYFPKAHHQKPCPCFVCVRRGQPFSRKLREAWRGV